MSMYQASIKLFGKTYMGKGFSVLKAITNLKPEKARGVCVLGVKKDDKSKEIILNRLQTTRLFSVIPAVRAATLKTVAERFGL